MLATLHQINPVIANISRYCKMSFITRQHENHALNDMMLPLYQISYSQLKGKHINLAAHFSSSIDAAKGLYTSGDEGHYQLD